MKNTESMTMAREDFLPQKEVNEHIGKACKSLARFNFDQKP